MLKFYLRKWLKKEGGLILIKMDYKVAIYEDEDGVFTAECLELPGCISDGNTKEEAVENIKEAIDAYSESILKEKTEKLKGKIVNVTV